MRNANMLSDEPARRSAWWLWLFIIAIAASAVWAFFFMRQDSSDAAPAEAAAGTKAAPTMPPDAAVPAAGEKPVQPGIAPVARRPVVPPIAEPPPAPTHVVEAPKAAQENPASESAIPAAVPSVTLTTYDAASADVVPPVLLTPTVNPLTRKDTRYEPGAPAIEVFVNPDGSVQSVKAATRPATIGQTLEMVNGLSITKSWRFDPAVRDGLPVRYRLLVPLSALAARKAIR